MMNSSTLRRRLLILPGLLMAALALAGCTDNTAKSSQINPLAAYQADTPTSGTPTNGQTQGVGAIDSPIVTVPYPTDGRTDHNNAPLLDNWHPGWQQSDCFACHTDQSRIPDHQYPDTTNCYLCHGTNGMPGFGDATPPIIKGIIPSPTNTSVTITWTTDEPCLSKLILRTSDGDRMDFPVSMNYAQSHKYTVQGLLTNKTYTYEIVCTDKNRNQSTTASIGIFSFTTLATVSGTTGTTPGSTPTTSFFTNIHTTDITSTGFTVEWSTSEPSTCNVVIMNSSGTVVVFESDSKRPLNTTVPSNYSVKMIGMQFDTMYTYFIKSKADSDAKLYNSPRFKQRTNPL